MTIISSMEVMLNSVFFEVSCWINLIDTLHDSSFEMLIGNDLDPLPDSEDFEIVPLGAMTCAQAAE